MNNLPYFIRHVVLLHFFFSVGTAQIYNPSERYYFVGTLGEDLRIQMDLSLEDTRVVGQYYYEHIGEVIDLEGSIPEELDEVVILDLQESVNGRLSGSWKGEIRLPDGFTLASEDEPVFSFIGTWQNTDSTKNLPFELLGVAEYTFLRIDQGSTIDTDTALPFFVEPSLENLNNTLFTKATEQHLEFIQLGQREILEGYRAIGWGWDSTYNIAYYDKGLVSIFEMAYTFSGGAHGNQHFAPHNYSISNGVATELKLADLFKENSNYVTILSNYILDDLREQEAPYAVDGSQSNLTSEDLTVFAFSPKGISFGFAPYIMGPYVVGSFEVTVPFSALSNVIDPEGSLGRFASP